MKPLRPSPLSRTLALIPPAVMLASQHADAGFSGYIKIGDIKGEATEAKHSEWIVVDSVQWGVGRSISMSAGAGDRVASNPSISELTITKLLDKSTPSLFLNAVGGSGPITTVTLELTTLELTTSGTTSQRVFYRLTLNDVLISKLSTSAASEDARPSESVSLNFAKIKIEYFIKNADGSTTAVPAVGFDLSKQVPF